MAYNGGSPVSPADTFSGWCDSAPSEASAYLPANTNMGYVSMYGKNEHGYVEYSFPVQDSESATAMGLVPVDLLDLESLCVDQGNRRKESASDEVMCSRILSRRRAQNRASQQAYRKRQEKHRKGLEEALTELQALHSDLNQSYENLQLEYSAGKQELENLRRGNCKHESVSSTPGYYASGVRECDGPTPVASDPVLLEVFSVFNE